MHLRFLTITLILCVSFLTACSAAQPTPESNAEPTAVPTEAVTADTAKEAYPGPLTPDDNAYPPAEQASGAIDMSSYPAPDPNTGQIPALQPTTRYQIADVDHVLDILLGDKGSELSTRIIYEQAACTTTEGLGGPPKCAEGEAEGTQLEVLPSLGGEASFLRKNDTNLNDLPGNVELLGVFKVRADFKSEEYYPTGTYGLVIRSKTNNQVLALRVNPDGIVRVDYLFNPPDLGQPDLESYLKPVQ